MIDNSRIRILLVDDHPVIRDGLAAILATQPDMEVVGEVSDGAQAIAQYRKLLPDITLMDIQMPVLDGVGATRALRQEFPQAKIIVLTTYSGDAQAARALKAGAAAYLLKSALRKELLDTIRAVCAGRRHVDANVATSLAIHSSDTPLTERELEILTLVASGCANKEVAQSLSVSEDTIKGHLKSIFAKLDVRDRTQAVVTAAKRGIISI